MRYPSVGDAHRASRLPTVQSYEYGSAFLSTSKKEMHPCFFVFTSTISILNRLYMSKSITSDQFFKLY